MNFAPLKEVIDKYKNDSPILLCQNAADMQRWRIKLHQTFNDLVLLGASFYTIRQWALQTLANASGGSHQKIASPLQTKILMQRALEKKPTVKPTNGFRDELIATWQSQKYQEQSSELPQPMHEIISDFEEMLAKYSLNHIAPLLAEIETHSDRSRPVIWLFPSVLSLSEKRLLGILDSHFSPQYSIVMPAEAKTGWLQKHLPDSMLQRCDFLTLAIEVNTSQAPFFFSERLNFIRATNLFSEASLVARTCRWLVDQQVKPNDIAILFSERRQTAFLQAACARANLRVDIQESRPGSGIGLAALAHSLLQLTASPGMAKNRATLIELIMNPAFNMKAVFKRRRLNQAFRTALRRKIEKSIAPTFFLKSTVSDEDLQLVLTYLINLGDSIAAKAPPSQMAESWWLQLKQAALTPEFLGQPNYQGSIDAVGRLVSSLTDLDAIFENSINKREFFSILQTELGAIRFSQNGAASDQLYEAVLEDQGSQDSTGIILRHSSEGLHAPASYLFILGADVNNLLRRNSYAIAEPAFEPGYEEQRQRIRQTIATAENFSVLSYAVDESPSPSEIIFELAGVGPSEKEDFIQSLPVYSHNPGEVPMVNGQPFDTAGHVSELLFSEKNEDAVSDYSQGASLKDELQHHYRVNQKRLQQFAAYNEFTAENQQIATREFSATSLQELAACPQRFWFKRILKLDSREETTVAEKISRREEGSHFHRAARVFIERLRSEKPGETYRSIFNSMSDDYLVEMLRDIFHSEHIINDRMASPLIADAQVRQFEERFTSYFRQFALTAAEGLHTLAHFVPLAVEHKFTQVKLAGLVFEGSIDRVDYDPLNKRLLVADYKIGGYPKSARRHYEEGLQTLMRVQLAVYMVAAMAEQLVMPEKVSAVSGTYLYISRAANGSELLPPIDTKFKWHRLEPSEKIVSLNRSGLIYETDLIKDLSERIQVLSKHLKDGDLFALPHKLGNDPGKAWSEPCKFCEYKRICDGHPFEPAWQRFKNSPTTREMYDLFYAADEDKE